MNMKHIAARLTQAGITLAAVATLAGCGGGTVSLGPAQALTQSNLCEVNAWQRDAVAKACKLGQKVAFLPDSWGNEQLPIYFAAVNCDLRYQVALTKGGVTCIFI